MERNTGSKQFQIGCPILIPLPIVAKRGCEHQQTCLKVPVWGIVNSYLFYSGYIVGHS
jgi:hypothetical protein